MMTLSSQESAIAEALTWDRRIGKSNFWVQVSREEPGPTSSWRLGILQKPARASKNKPPLLLAQFSPQNPLFTFELDGQRYPLMIGRISSSRGGKIVMGGVRKVGPNLSSMLTWVADIVVTEDSGTAHVRIDGRFRVPGLGKKNVSLRIQIPLVVYQPMVIESPLPDAQNITAAAVWAARAEAAIGLLLPTPSIDGVTFSNNALLATVSEVDTRGRTPVRTIVALRPSAAGSGALQLVRSEAADSATAMTPVVPDLQIPIMEPARAGIEQMMDSKSCTTIGKERWYFHASGQYEYGPGFPFFTVEAAPALMRWNRFFQSEMAQRTANLTARGVAADFAVIVGESGAEGNKGAFWDCAAGSPEKLILSTFEGRKEYGIASNARIALALFEMFSVSRDPLFRQAALNTCHWLLLKQDKVGYYDGPFVSAKSGRFTEQKLSFDGVLAIRPLVAAFRTTGNEVFIKAAWKIAAHLKSILLTTNEAPCLYNIGASKNCPVTLSAVVHCLLDLDAEAPNDDLRRTLSIIADWLAVCRFDDETHRCLSYDGAYSGSIECALASLRLFAFTGKERWFRLGHTLIEHTVNQGIVNWRLADAAVQLMLCIPGLLTGVTVDTSALTVSSEWRTYAPDAAAAQYYDVRDSEQTNIDFLPLVCRETNQTLVIVLARTTLSGIHLIKRNSVAAHRVPICDMVTGEQCTLDVPMHPLPSGEGQFAVLKVDP